MESSSSSAASPSGKTPSASPSARGARVFLALLSVSAFLALTAYLFACMDTGAFLAIWSRISAGGLLVPLGVYFLLNLLRAVRFRIMLDERVPMGLLYPVTLYYNFLAQTFPMRSGELSYVVILRRHRPDLTSRGASGLVGSKLFEMLMVAAGGLIGATSLSDRLQERFGMLCAALGLGLLVCFWSIYRSGTFAAWLTALLRSCLRIPLFERWPVAARLAERMGDVARHLEDMRRPGRFLAMAAVSAGTYLASVAFNLYLLRLAGVEAGFLPLLAVISLVMAAGVLPLSVAGLGLIEGSWVFGMTILLGMPRGEAIAIGFFLHGCQLLAACIAGIAGYLWQWQRRERERERTQRESETTGQ